MREYHTNNKVHFWLKFNEGKNVTDYNIIVKNFKLRTTLQISNLVLFNNRRQIKKYKEVKEILEEYYVERYEKFKQRKSYLLSKVNIY
jgi:DNA topoisomerase-2